MSTLFINACVREESRTLAIAKEVIKRHTDGKVTELVLAQESLAPLDRASLQKRDRLLAAGQLDDPMLAYARQFAAADEIVIAAPFWDLSFPALLKIYFEQVSVVGVTFAYQNGIPVGLCRAKRLIYVTTAGGEIVDDFGYPYVKALATRFYGIGETVAYRAMNLDVLGISADRVLLDAEIQTLL